MAKKNKSPKKQKKRARPAAGSAGNSSIGASSVPGITATGETRTAEILTIGWMLCTLATTISLTLGLAALALRGIASLHETMTFLAGLLLYIALASGLATLALTWPVLRLRRIAPPRAITRFALAIGAAPLVVVALLELAG